MAELASTEDKYQSRFNRTISDTLSGNDNAQANNNPATSQDFHRTSVKSDKADIRLSLGKYYLVIMFGKEQRSDERLAQDRESHPLLTRTNIRAIFFAWLFVFLVALFSQSVLY